MIKVYYTRYDGEKTWVIMNEKELDKWKERSIYMGIKDIKVEKYQG